MQSDKMATNELDEIPFYPECEVLDEGECSATLNGACRKNPGHPTFIPATDFGMQHLPVDCQTKTFLELIKVSCDLTVKIIIKYTSPDRPDTYPDSTAPYPYSELRGSNRAVRNGTGFVTYILRRPTTNGNVCPCPPCKSGKAKMEYFEAFVQTATHVIVDDSEATKAEFECFYDSSDRSGVKYLYGVSMADSDALRDFRCNTDSCWVKCVTHDSKLIALLKRSLERHRWYYNTAGPENSPHAVVISHPHGMRKHVTVGRILHATIGKDAPFSTDKPNKFALATKCRLPLAGTNNNNKNPLPSLGQRSSQSDIATSQTSENQNVTDPILDLGYPMEPEKEYHIPTGMTFTLPANPQYIHRIQYPVAPSWITFPAGTKFTLPGGDDANLPDDLQFSWNKDNFLWCHQYFSYDIDTCRGSSGALILPYSKLYLGSHQTHHGATDDGTNRSGLAVVYSCFKDIRFSIIESQPDVYTKRFCLCVSFGVITLLCFFVCLLLFFW